MAKTSIVRRRLIQNLFLPAHTKKQIQGWCCMLQKEQGKGTRIYRFEQSTVMLLSLQSVLQTELNASNWLSRLVSQTFCVPRCIPYGACVRQPEISRVFTNFPRSYRLWYVIVFRRKRQKNILDNVEQVQWCFSCTVKARTDTNCIGRWGGHSRNWKIHRTHVRLRNFWWQCEQGPEDSNFL